MPWDTHQELEEPLLPSRGRPPNPSLQQHQPGTQHSKQAARPGDPRSRSSKEGPKQQTVDLGSRFLRRLCVILRIISATPALSLVVLSLAETVIVSKIGTISGLFYQGVQLVGDRRTWKRNSYCTLCHHACSAWCACWH